MFKKIFLVFSIIFLLVNSVWAGVYKGKLAIDFADGHPENFVFDFIEIKNDLGLEVEFYNDFVNHLENYLPEPDGYRIFTNSELYLLIKNPDFSIKFKNLNVVVYFKREDGFLYQVINPYPNQNIKLIDIQNNLQFDTLKERAKNAIYFGDYCNFIHATLTRIADPREIYFMIEDPDVNINQRRNRPR